MDEKKKTNIIALTDFTEIGNSAVRHAATLALVFKSSLTIVHRFETVMLTLSENSAMICLKSSFSVGLDICVVRNPNR